ncbi:MAG: ATP-binding cassette domain-containing protein [bacterium]|nr:ATP-binding cassette domain-containing protein [bacterium]
MFSNDDLGPVAADTAMPNTATPEPAAPLLCAQGLSKSFDEVTVLSDCNLDVRPGEMIALLGPSGCGKTTLLRIIAGLEQSEAGEVRVNTRLVASKSTWVRPEDRNVGMVFQDWALFPHLDVSHNVGYGVPRRMRSKQVQKALELVGMAAMAQRMPDTLSGGQQQRVALARALAPEPAVLLLDEPFSNLDSALRREVRSEVRQLLQETQMTAVFVTHDREEALVLGDRVALMNEGRIVQFANPDEIYQQPATTWAANFIGTVSLYPALAHGNFAESNLGSIPLQKPASGPVEVVVRPEAVELSASAGNHTVEHQEYQGADTLVTVVSPCGTRLRARVSGTTRFTDGNAVTPTYVGPPATAFQQSQAQNSQHSHQKHQNHQNGQHPKPPQDHQPQHAQQTQHAHPQQRNAQGIKVKAS